MRLKMYINWATKLIKQPKSTVTEPIVLITAMVPQNKILNDIASVHGRINHNCNIPFLHIPNGNFAKAANL